MPARGNAPGIVPSLAIRPVGAEDPCAPTGRATFRLAPATQGVPWASVRRRSQRRKMRCWLPILKNRSMNIFVPLSQGIYKMASSHIKNKKFIEAISLLCGLPRVSQFQLIGGYSPFNNGCT